MEDLQRVLLGEQSLGYFLGYSILYIIGVFIFYAIKVKRRKSKKLVRFSWTYFSKTNGLEILLSLCIMYISIRAYTDIEPYFSDKLPFKYKISQVLGTIILGMSLQYSIKLIGNLLFGKEKVSDSVSYINKNK